MSFDPIRNVIQLISPPREFTLLNSTDEDIDLTYNAETRTVPKTDMVVQPDAIHPIACYSAKDNQGNFISGSLVLRDIYDSDPNLGGEIMVWSAANAIKHCLDINVKTGTLDGAYAKRGISVLPANPDPLLVHQVRQDGRRRYNEFQVEVARQIVEAYDSKNETRKRIGLPEVPGSAEVEKAILLLQSARETQKQLMAKKIQAATADLESEAGEAIEAQEQEDEAVLFQLAAQKKAEAAASRVAKDDLEKAALATALLKDEKFRKIVEAQITFKTGKKVARKKPVEAAGA